ncbi:MAG: carboxypeptidase regulatory-like domain-containing protein [Verrucomicrobia bacterium]|nr:carboxypeptidase regulatory-like domain-containing protein [Verrucomicrobiota bacterium]
MTNRCSALVRACFSLLLALAATTLRSPAQTPATGVIVGRVANAHSGEFLENARVTVDGTALEAFTDDTGEFRLEGVPAGTAKLRVFFTGFDAHTESIVVTAGATLTREITLGAPRTSRPAAGSEIVKLDQFVVATTREMDGAAIAINEQRFAPNTRTVASTDEYGNVAEGNPAEFLKFLPGVTIDYTGGNARDISINGVPSDNVPVTVDGFNVATAANRGTGRAVQSDMISINGLSRIEVSYSPTPESQGSALAGSVNMVPRSAFERSRPVLNWSTYLLMRDNARDFSPVPGPRPSATRNVHPGFDFNYIAPLSKFLGVTLSAGYSTNYSPQDQMTNTWRGAQAATNGVAFPHTTPDQPYLSTLVVQDAPKVTTRRSVGASLDLKITPRDRLTFGFQYSSFDGRFVVANLTMNVNRVAVGDFSTTSTRGAVGLGDITSAHNERNRFNRTYMPSFVWRHDGPIWKADAGFGFSQQSDFNRDSEQGFFRTVTVRRTNLTVNFNDIFYLRPRIVDIRDGASGAAFDPNKLANYALTTATTQADATYDLQRTAYGSLRRDFGGRVPFALKAGFDVREARRDIRGATRTFNYVGPDGRASTTPVGSDDSATPFFDPVYSQRVLPYGFGALETVSSRKVWEHYVAHPNYFTVNETTAYTALVTNSKFSDELVSALYLRGDTALFNRRLKLVGGLRAEQTNIDAEGPLVDPTRNFRHDAAGKVVLVNNRPVAITTDTLAAARLTNVDRGTHVDKEYLRFFPSLNASFNLRENLIARAAYYWSVGRPNFVQYSGGITLPDTETPGAATAPIVVNNAGIKAWSARTVSTRLEYYFEGVGQVSIGGFRREIKNAFDTAQFQATPEFLAIYDLPESVYGNLTVQTQANIATPIVTEGVDFSYKQALTFLPAWARGVQVFANASAQRVTGDDTAGFAGYIPRSGSWGVSLTRPKFNVRVNWNYRGRTRNAQIAQSVSVGPGTFNWSSSRLYMDVLGEYNFYRRLSLFANLRNFKDATEDIEIAGPLTPSHAQFRQRIDYAALWTIGVKGTW